MPWAPRCARLLTRLGAIAIFATVMTVAPTTVVSAEDLCYHFTPGRARLLGDFVWTGTVKAIRSMPREPGISVKRDLIVFDVDKVFARLPDPDPDQLPPGVTFAAGEELLIPTSRCGGIRGLREGHRYLVAAEYIPGATLGTSGSAIWELSAGGGTKLVRMYDGRTPTSLSRPETMTAVLRLLGVAPPDTDGASAAWPADPPRAGLADIAVALGILGGGWFVLRQRRSDVTR